VHRIVRRISDGAGRLQDLDDLLAIARDMEGKTICVFADAAAWPVQSYITKFRSEFENHILTGTCVSGSHARLPRMGSGPAREAAACLP
jgi:NADH-quinone oxidoreductase subunit F